MEYYGYHVTPLEMLCLMPKRIPEVEYDLNAILDLFHKHTGSAEEAEALLMHQAIDLDHTEMIAKIHHFNQSQNNE